MCGEDLPRKSPGQTWPVDAAPAAVVGYEGSCHEEYKYASAIPLQVLLHTFVHLII